MVFNLHGGFLNMTKAPVSRAKSTDEIDAIFAKIFTDDCMAYATAFQPDPTDIIIAPAAKCGTTWLQQIAHGLRTRGSMDFDEVSTVTPWIEMSYALGLDLNAPHAAEPRVYKSHDSWDDVPKGGRYIVSFRNPTDAFVSLYRFFEGFMFEPDTIDIDTFFHWRFPPEKTEGRGFMQHMASWWEQRDNPDVLLLCYEDMRAEHAQTVRRVAAFMNVTLDDALFDLVMHQSSRAFMLAHKEQFSDAPVRQLIADLMGMPVDGESAKVTPGVSDDPKYQLTPKHKQLLDDMWQSQMKEKFGLKNYEALRQSVRGLHETG